MPPRGCSTSSERPAFFLGCLFVLLPFLYSLPFLGNGCLPMQDSSSSCLLALHPLLIRGLPGGGRGWNGPLAGPPPGQAALGPGPLPGALAARQVPRTCCAEGAVRAVPAVLCSLHEPPVIHRDLKSPNLLVSRSFFIPVSSFLGSLPSLLPGQPSGGGRPRCTTPGCPVCHSVQRAGLPAGAVVIDFNREVQSSECKFLETPLHGRRWTRT